MNLFRRLFGRAVLLLSLILAGVPLGGITAVAPSHPAVQVASVSNCGKPCCAHRQMACCTSHVRMLGHSVTAPASCNCFASPVNFIPGRTQASLTANSVGTLEQEGMATQSPTLIEEASVSQDRISAGPPGGFGSSCHSRAPPSV